MKRIGLLLIFLSIVCTLSCSTTYYTRAFRLESVNPGSSDKHPPEEVFTGPLGTVAGWNMAIRVISTYESNEKTVLQRDTFAVSLIASSANTRTLPPAIDSLHMTLGGDTAVTLGLESVTADTLTYAPETWQTYRFGNVIIPPGEDTVQVRFTARSPQLAVPEGKEFILTMVRYEGRFKKFGHYAKGW